jgi:hypothetical protein
MTGAALFPAPAVTVHPDGPVSGHGCLINRAQP